MTERQPHPGVSRGFAIAVDGPASSGKGTAARLVARDLGFVYVDTGAMYRAVALVASRRGIAWDDGAALADMIGGLCFEFGFEDGRFSIGVDGEDVSQLIREETIGQGASAVAVQPLVREALLETQRGLAREQGVVMDGRDIGTVVLPAAELKIFLDAAVDVRARRRHTELIARGEEASFAAVRAELIARDAQDSSRQAAPLAQAEDAVYLDTSDLTPEGARDAIVRLARRRGVG